LIKAAGNNMESVPLLPRKAAGANALSGALNLSNTLLGGGIAFVALPLATKQVGVFGIVAMLVASGVANTFTCMLLVKSAALTGRATYFDLSRALGDWAHVCTIFILLNNFGVCVAFLDTFGDVFPQALGAMGAASPSRLGCVLGASALLLLPMVGLRSLDALRFLSALSILLCLFFAAIVLNAFAARRGPLPTAPQPSFTGALDALSAATLSFTCHYNVLPIAAGLARPQEVRGVVRRAMAFGTVLFSVIGPLAFFCHPGTTGDILADFATAGGGVSATLLGRLAVALALMFSFPLIAFEGVHCAHLLAERALSPRIVRLLDTPAGKKVQALLFTALCAAVALGVRGTGKVIGFVGSFCGIPIMYLFPCAIFLNASAERAGEKPGAAPVAAAAIATGDDGDGAAAMAELIAPGTIARDRSIAKGGFAVGVVCFVLCTASSVLAFRQS
jgi:amino acid permease